jgi:hypothetical protein
MLERLLRLVAGGGVYSYEDLMVQLGVSQALLELMLEDLSRFGYLRAVENGFGGHCSGCSVGGCSVVVPGRLWTLTEKGSAAASRLGA